MNWKRRIGLGLVLGILTCFGSGVSAAGEEISAEDISVTWNDSRVYMEPDLETYTTITTYGVRGYEDVPFVSIPEYLNILLDGAGMITMDGSVMHIFLNGTEAVIDPEADTIRFENTARFRSSVEAEDNAVDGGIVEGWESEMITVSRINQSSQGEAHPLTISLKDYHMPVMAWGDTILMPFLGLQNTFGSVCLNTVLAYNGKDYFNVSELSGSTDGNAYSRAVYSGPFSELKQTTQAYADYGYYSVCLLLDLTFGHKDEKNITTFDEYFTRINARNSMCSTNPASAITAEFMLFNYLFDSGHDSVISVENVFGEAESTADFSPQEFIEEILETEDGRELFEEGNDPVGGGQQTLPLDVIVGALTEKGLKIPEVAPLLGWSYYMEWVKPLNYGNERLDLAGDTAVIYFDEFMDNCTERDSSYYQSPVTEEDEAQSTFAFLHGCFEEIRKHGEVKNVVFNIADNGGGRVTALVSVLGFLSDDGEVTITNRDLMAGSYRKECYHVDTNLDGVADAQDGFGGEYNFYVMCSGSSYSCGNALPYYAQKQGLASVIGTPPGGGDCIVGFFVDAYGRSASYSGMIQLGSDEGSGFVSDEEATVPDLNMMPSVIDINSVPWYDPAGIADVVHQYRNGAAEISYHNGEEESVTDYLQDLLWDIVG